MTGQYRLRKQVVECRHSHNVIVPRAPYHPLTQAVPTAAVTFLANPTTQI
jgi:hypothetical protein